jgi:ElaB/YqjD/DUF883 family membrane-anchored ribosome-binding protein
MGSRAGKSASDDEAEHVRDQQTDAGAGEPMEHLREAAAECYAAGEAEARLVSQMVEDYIRQHPVKTLLGAAGAGFLLALFVMRRK